mgnify:CR=1 FL=1
MYLINNIEKIDNRPVIGTIYGIEVPQYPYKASEFPQELAGIGEYHDIFYDACMTVEEHTVQQRDYFEAQLEKQGLSTEEFYKRLGVLMAAYRDSCGDGTTGDFQLDFETYRAENCLHSKGIKQVVADHTISSMWSIFCVNQDTKRIYYANDGTDYDGFNETIDPTSRQVIDVTDCIYSEARSQGVSVPPLSDIEGLQEFLGRLLWGLVGGVVVKNIRVVK